ncbi:MAG: hypothetical protein LBR53_01005 [Deltaproteobacteria bacterium]|jgi:transposase|nr:hypothetical protein [Deltaproteobacteria bacterium]
MVTRERLRAIFHEVWPGLSEKERRLFAADKARELGHGGISLVSEICGLSRTTISKGLKELKGPLVDDGRVRRPGAGRPNLLTSDQDLPLFLQGLIESAQTLEGGNAPPVSWTLKSTRMLARELAEAGHPVSYVKVGQMLKELGYALKSNKRTARGRDSFDLARQYALINAETTRALDEGRPVVYLQKIRASPSSLNVKGEPRKARSASDFLAAWLSGWLGDPERRGSPLPVLLVLHDEARLPRGGDGGAEELKERLAGRSVPARLLPFPSGTHRWNLEMSRLFSVRVQDGGPKERLDLETKLFLVTRGEPRERIDPSEYLLTAEDDPAE